uniref:NADAR domain-containing protein n=1 Tax=Bionectria ochroleuca TaxID=29856 RepID=A0A8H7KDD5_BIOOC
MAQLQLRRQQAANLRPRRAARELLLLPGDYSDDIPFVTAEQFMMFCKAACFGDRSIAAQILQTRDPRDQKGLGRAVAGFDPVKWDAVKSSVVAAASLAKFGQNEELRALLLGTGRRELIEAAPNDRIWGIGFSEKDARNMRSRREWGKICWGGPWWWPGRLCEWRTKGSSQAQGVITDWMSISIWLSRVVIFSNELLVGLFLIVVIWVGRRSNRTG